MSPSCADGAGRMCFLLDTSAVVVVVIVVRLGTGGAKVLTIGLRGTGELVRELGSGGSTLASALPCWNTSLGSSKCEDAP